MDKLVVLLAAEPNMSIARRSLSSNKIKQIQKMASHLSSERATGEGLKK
jgi:hypothetical protein